MYIHMVPRIAVTLAPLSFATGMARAEMAGTATRTGRAIDLEEAVRLAVARSETLAASAAGVEEAEARIAELRAAALPRLSLHATQKFQDDPGGDQVASRFNQSSQTTAWASLRQPLFSGFREFLLLRAGRALRDVEAADLARARVRLALDVAVAHAALLRTRAAAAIRREARDVTAQRVADLEERARVGRSRESEVLAARRNWRGSTPTWPGCTAPTPPRRTGCGS